jgi:hypothetical protein
VWQACPCCHLHAIPLLPALHQASRRVYYLSSALTGLVPLCLAPFLPSSPVSSCSPYLGSLPRLPLRRSAGLPRQGRFRSRLHRVPKGCVSNNARKLPPPMPPPMPFAIACCSSRSPARVEARRCTRLHPQQKYTPPCLFLSGLVRRLCAAADGAACRGRHFRGGDPEWMGVWIH